MMSITTVTPKKDNIFVILRFDFIEKIKSKRRITKMLSFFGVTVVMYFIKILSGYRNDVHIQIFCTNSLNITDCCCTP